MSRRIQFEQWVPVEVGKVFLFFANPQNLPRIMPPTSATKLIAVNLAPVPPSSGAAPAVLEKLAGVNSEIVTSFRWLSFLPFRARWTARITEFEWNRHFADVQEKGPFKSFHHRHEFESEMRDGIQGTIARDVIDYEIGLGFLGSFAEKFVSTQLEQTFQYRQGALEKLLVQL